MSETLGEALPKQIKRCNELIRQYESLGPVGNFGKMMIQMDIDQALKAMAEGDLPGMLRAYEALKGCE